MAVFIRDVYTDAEYVDSRPDKALINIDERLAQRILKHSKLVRNLKVYQITEFDYTPDWKETGIKKPEWSIDCSILEVEDDSFQWSGLIKHTNIELVTRPIYIKELLKRFPSLKG